MYRALAQALAHDQNQHSVLRKEVVTFIKQNRQDFEVNLLNSIGIELFLLFSLDVNKFFPVFTSLTLDM